MQWFWPNIHSYPTPPSIVSKDNITRCVARNNYVFSIKYKSVYSRSEMITLMRGCLCLLCVLILWSKAFIHYIPVGRGTLYRVYTTASCMMTLLPSLGYYYILRNTTIVYHTTCPSRKLFSTFELNKSDKFKHLIFLHQYNEKMLHTSVIRNSIYFYFRMWYIWRNKICVYM